MKCTLRQLAEGIVATVDEPIYNEWAQYLNDSGNITERLFYPIDNTKRFKLIIASTFGVGKKMCYKINNTILRFDNVHIYDIEFKDYEYTETETSIMTQL